MKVRASIVKMPKVALWEWPNVLSLDAPLIAALWQELMFAQTFGVALGWPYALLLYSAVWLIYSADRWLDGRTLGEGARTQRHLFYARHRGTVLWCWLSVGVGTLAASVVLLTWRQLLGGALVGLLLLGYLLRRHRGDRTTHPKELQIAVIFALGVVFLPLLSGVSAPLLFGGGLFGVLIFLNCAYIARWEGELDQETAPFAVRAPWFDAHLAVLSLSFALLCGVGGLLAGPLRPLFAAFALSALLLYSLEHLSTTLSPAARRVLADAALLTPLLWLMYG